MELLTKASCSNIANMREQKNLKIAYEAACESIVLLKNDGILPFLNKKVALYGAGASKTTKGGTGSGEVNERHSTTILEGMEQAGFEITTRAWIKDFEIQYKSAEEIFCKNKWKNVLSNPMSLLSDFPGIEGRLITETDIRYSETDACVYVLSRQAGEGVDRHLEKGDFLVTDIERANIEICARAYSQFVLIINGGAQIDLSFLDDMDGVNAILFICQLGTAGGLAVADVLCGKVNPSGKLTDTWAKTYSDIPFAKEFSYLNGNLKDEYYKEDIFVGYRYFDTFEKEPRYPLGYGLSYTSFEQELLEIKVENTCINVKVRVTNTGTFAGKEVIQLYVSAPKGTIDKEYQKLVGFAKTPLLNKGESAYVVVDFEMTQMASYFENDASFKLDAGEYILRVGNSSRNTFSAAVLILEELVVVSKHCNVCPSDRLIYHFRALSKQQDVIGEDIQRILIRSEAFKTRTFSYRKPPICKDLEVQKFLKTLTTEEMIEIVVGIGMFGGERRFELPGSVGNTTSKFWDRGLVNITFCDGPAGIRIQKRTAVMKDSSTKAIDPVFSFIGMLPGAIKKFMLADPNKSKVIYQFTTAFPVACALAQTWNTELLYQVGMAIHEEMKEYGCTFWLAPALNIHRNPLCGRNFEYYSEDPFLSGKMAAAVTKGVQCEDGYYVAIKHFVCNNQEDNRKNVSSNVSERALREIYLKGFEIAVREGGAKGVMTSYNKVNGVYAPNNYDLCMKVLRNEWGFDGVVMTDWFSTGKGCGDTAACMAAGNDLIMPGGYSYKKEMLNALKKGTLKEEDLKWCCANVLKAVLGSALQMEYMSKGDAPIC